MITDTQLADAFRAEFPNGAAPRLCRAPGRINLIGEHTDYNGLPVLPMAIDREIRVVFAPSASSQVRVRSAASFSPADFDNGARIPASPTGSWENYCKAAIQGINDHFRPKTFRGMDLLAAGDIPVAAGLSSSSAVVVACALAYLAILEKELDRDISRREFADLLADAEHYVGTRGGGMDQAIILHGQAGQAAKIDFFPLRIEQVPLPEGFDIVACNSLVKAAKTGDALHRYNEGPRTCQLIRAMVERQLQEEFGDEVQIERLGELWLGNLCLTHSEASDILARIFPNEFTALDEAAERLGITVATIRKRWLGDLPEPEKGFRLQARARHQCTEYQRVEAARDALRAGDAAELGRLMNESHESCARDYAVSCPELDRLVDAARSAGALGARLTGAGFGGCTVNVVPAPDADSFVERVKRDYYESYLKLSRSDIPADAVAILSPNEGAGYLS